MLSENDYIIVEDNLYIVKEAGKRRFEKYGCISAEDKQQCFDFAFDMSFGHQGEHRSCRSGGTKDRNDKQIFRDAFQGKMAEYAFYRYMLSKFVDMSKPDLEVHGLGKWDAGDMTCQGKHISVKSTKDIGNLLLLEEKDWNQNGEYIPNLKVKGAISKYDYTVLVRLKITGNEENNLKKVLEQSNTDTFDFKDSLREVACSIDWIYDFAGYIKHDELLDVIRHENIVPKGATLNKHTKMDASNYCVTAGEMHKIEEIYAIRQDAIRNGRIKEYLYRLCPGCKEKPLVVRNGKYGEFWGCYGYPECGYTEKK